MTTIPTQPIPPHVDRAADALEAVLLTDLDVDTRLAVAAALASLLDVHPPYAPPGAVPSPMPASEGLGTAREALRVAATEAGSVAEAIRIGLAAHELAHLP